MIKIGVLGTGHLGKIHLRCLGMLPDQFEIVGFYDSNQGTAAKISEEFGYQAFPNLGSLFAAVDAVDIVTPTTTHFQLAQEALLQGKHVFVEKPMTHTLAEAEALLELSEKTGLKVQVGHVERFNPALLSLSDASLNPKFIEAHRLATFNPRGTDVSVVLDLMIHDLDIVQSLVKSPIERISANGVAVVSSTPDIANARLEFANGCVANLTASRISMKQMRKVRFFQRDAYISLDFLEKQAQIIRLYDEGDAKIEQLDNALELQTNTGKKFIHIDMPDIEPVNAIKLELETFYRSIVQNQTPPVSAKDGFTVLKIAYGIIEQIEQQAALKL